MILPSAKARLPADTPGRRLRRAARTPCPSAARRRGGLGRLKLSGVSSQLRQRAQSTGEFVAPGRGGEGRKAPLPPPLPSGPRWSWGRGSAVQGGPVQCGRPSPGSTHPWPVGWWGKAGNTAHSGHARVVAGDRATWGKGHSSSPGARPRPHLVRSRLGKSILACHQSLCRAHVWGRGSQDSGCKQVHERLQTRCVFQHHCWSVLKPPPRRVKTPQGAQCRPPDETALPHRRRALGWARATPGATRRRGLASVCARGGTPPPLQLWTRPSPARPHSRRPPVREQGRVCTAPTPTCSPPLGVTGPAPGPGASVGWCEHRR